ncbi:MAG TPA: Na+/H+ antiporter NhaA [Gemmatimonadaceae bacterium]
MKRSSTPVERATQLSEPGNQRRGGPSAAFQDFLERGTLSGILLIASTVVALLWANSPWADSYLHLWETRISVGPVAAPSTLSLHHWINDGLMAVFFLLVGLEIKRELLVGELASPRQAALPIAAAIGGMVIPAIAYSVINWGGDGLRGWGIPMATDIAFALGILTLLGPRIPVGLKVFLTALAIVDDMGAVIVIALFYTAAINTTALVAAGTMLIALMVLNRMQVKALAPYLIIGLVLWAALLASGIHATIAGVLLALTVPSRTRINALEFSAEARRLLDQFDLSETGDLVVLTSKGQQEAVYGLDTLSSAVQAPLLRLEHSLHGLVSFLIMPLFALANAGVALTGIGDVLGEPVTLGVIAGLLLGKPVGVIGFSWLAIRMGVARMPAQVTWRHLQGAACLAGIGFTMSLFVASLAFEEGGVLVAAKVGILAASVVAAVVGWQLLTRAATAAADDARSAS